METFVRTHFNGIFGHRLTAIYSLDHTFLLVAAQGSIWFSEFSANQANFKLKSLNINAIKFLAVFGIDIKKSVVAILTKNIHACYDFKLMLLFYML